MNRPAVSRRSFVGAAAASSLARVRGATIGFLSASSAPAAAAALMRALEKNKDLNFAITGVCDVYRPNRESAVERAAKTMASRRARPPISRSC